MRRPTALLAAALAATAAVFGMTSTSSAAAGHRLAESATRLPVEVRADGGSGPFSLHSPDFPDGGRIPGWAEFGGPDGSEAGCTSKNESPALDWADSPAGTESYALFVHDVDAPVAGGFTHWLTYNIPAAVHALPRNDDTAYAQGTTDWQAAGLPVVGYGGPCPPADGETHHYVFTLYALSTADIATSGLDYSDLMNAISPYVLAATSTIGTFSIPPQG
jgi:Raf kinase inhibitor-like YbhB/YbcL family protein